MSLYDNPTPVGRVTVTPAARYPQVMPCNTDGSGNPILINKAWHVTVNKVRTPFLVIQTRTGTTIIDGAGKMVTCWHAGVSPGDIARFEANGSRAITYGTTEK